MGTMRIVSHGAVFENYFKKVVFHDIASKASYVYFQNNISVAPTFTPRALFFGSTNNIARFARSLQCCKMRLFWVIFKHCASGLYCKVLRLQNPAVLLWLFFVRKSVKSIAIS